MNPFFRAVRTTALATALIFSFTLSSAADDDWPQYRGPQADGASPSRGVFESSASVGLDVSWKRPLGSGYSGVSIADGRVVTMFSHDTSDVLSSRWGSWSTRTDRVLQAMFPLTEK